MTKDVIERYVRSIILALVLFSFFSIYIFLRRGYYDLYIINKIFAGVSAIILGIILLIGPLSRLYDVFDGWVKYRKELGVVSFFAAFLHSVISLFFLPNKFPLSYFFVKHLNTFLFGLTGTIVLLLLFIISFERVIKHMNRKSWWSEQNWGVRIAGILVFLHVVVMKYQAWLGWYKSGGGQELARPYMIPAGLIVMLFVTYVGIAKLSELLGVQIARIITEFGFIFLIGFYIFSFAWGYRMTPKPLSIKWETCITLPGSRVLQSYPPRCVSPDGRVVTKSK